jgi:phenylacetate-coenzyme A ligase PaaK-like adenylate-forming protein
MEHFDEIVTDGRWRRAQVEAELTGAPAGERLDGFRVFSTAGSTGRRGVFVYAEDEFAVWVAAQVRMLRVMGVTPSMRVAAVGAPSPVHLSRQMFSALTGGRSSTAPELSVVTPVPELVAELNAYQPEAIPTYASTAALLAEEQLAGRLHIAPSMIAAGAEVLTADMRKRIRDAWGLDPQQAYLATEAPLLASTCIEQVGMHLWEDLTLVEVVNAHDWPVEPGVPGHKVLITNLVNRTLPLIRYELSDSVTLADGPDPTGMPFRRLLAIDGRSNDVITLPAADGTTATVHPRAIRRILRRSPVPARLRRPDPHRAPGAPPEQPGGYGRSRPSRLDSRTPRRRRRATTDRHGPGGGHRARSGTRSQVQTHQTRAARGTPQRMSGGSRSSATPPRLRRRQGNSSSWSGSRK